MWGFIPTYPSERVKKVIVENSLMPKGRPTIAEAMNVAKAAKTAANKATNEFQKWRSSNAQAIVEHKKADRIQIAFGFVNIVMVMATAAMALFTWQTLDEQRSFNEKQIQFTERQLDIAERDLHLNPMLEHEFLGVAEGNLDSVKIRYNTNYQLGIWVHNIGDYGLYMNPSPHMVVECDGTQENGIANGKIGGEIEGNFLPADKIFTYWFDIPPLTVYDVPTGKSCAFVVDINPLVGKRFYEIVKKEIEIVS